MDMRIAVSGKEYSQTLSGRGDAARNADGCSFADVLAAAAGPYDNGAGMDAVKLSGDGGLLSKATLLLPTMENIRILAADLSENMGSFFRRNGLSVRPPVELGMNYFTGEVTVRGDRSDLDRIMELVNGNPELRSAVHTLLALSSHARSLPEHLAFQAEYRASSDPEAVVAKYSHLFGRQEYHEFTVRFDGAAGLFVDGELWDISGTG